MRLTSSMLHGPRFRRPWHGSPVLLGSIGQSTWPAVAIRHPLPRLRVTIFTIWFQNFPNNFVILIAASAIAAAFIFIFAKSAMVAEGGRQGWVKRVTGPNAKILFTILFILWALVFGIGLQLVPHEGASSPYGGLGLIALFSGFFIIMGLAWSVIGD